MTFEYWNILAEQFIVICSLLGGFSIAVIANLLASETNTKLSRMILKFTVVAACSLLVSLFAESKVYLLTAEGFPDQMSENQLIIPSIIGGISMIIGVISLLAMISLSGRSKSKKLGNFTTIIGVTAFILIVMMMWY